MYKSFLTYCLLSLLIVHLFSCQHEKDPLPVDCNATDLALSVVTINDASGCETTDGSASFAATGGQPPYQFKMGSSDFQNSSMFNSLAPGNYTVTVKDDPGCEQETTVNIVAGESTLVFNSVTSTDAGCTTAESTITVEASGGDDILYSLNNGTFQVENIFTDVSAGFHEVKIKDNTGCESVAEHHVTSGVSYEQQVETIILNNCAVSGCHDGSNGSFRNWTIFSNVKSNAANIKKFTQDGTMPPGDDQTISEEQKALIACWVDDGALDN